MTESGGRSHPIARDNGSRISLALPLACLFILLTVSYRTWTLATAPASPQDLSRVQQAASQWLASVSPLPVASDGVISEDGLDPELLRLGVTRIELQSFDPQALVVIRPGADGQPGVAGVDDNGDALVDNRLELGATRSDDKCVVLPSGEKSDDDEVILVLQKGAYVVGSQPTDPQHRPRAVVFGQSGDSPWSFTVGM